MVASDTSFADNSEDRKSSEAYIMRLFGGVIGWQANKQHTVTTSTCRRAKQRLQVVPKRRLYVFPILIRDAIATVTSAHSLLSDLCPLDLGKAISTWQ